MVFLPEVSMRRFTSNVIIIDNMPVKIQTDSYKTKGRVDREVLQHVVSCQFDKSERALC